MIQDIGKGRYHNEYKKEAPKPESRVFVRKGREIFVKWQEGSEKGTMEFLTCQQVFSALPELEGQETYLFELDGITYFLFRQMGAEELFTPEAFPGFSWQKMEILRRTVPEEAAFAGITGFQLSNWYTNRRFCPRCGKPMVHDEKERMMKCPDCRLTEYPKICPAVIVGVTNGDKLLMTKYAGRGHTNYALIAGFVEIGETLEECVEREVMEEVGLKVKNIRYYKSQPWSFTDTLLMGFFCDLDGSDAITLDQMELAVGKWCDRDEIPENDGISLTREMMSVFKYAKEK